MNRILSISAIIVTLFFSASKSVHGQEMLQQDYAINAHHRPANGGNTGTVNATMHPLHSKNGMNATPGNNYKWFTAQYKNVSNEALAANKGYENHPELGMLFAETPCDNCYELLDKRTELSKTFVKEGTNGRDVMCQTSSEPMHYRDAQGNWRTIKSKIRPDNDHRGVYAANEQPHPVSINTNNGNSFSSLGKPGESFQFNHNLELIYQQANGSQLSLGAANWANFTAGDDGIYVTNAWPGIDIEMFAFWGGVKTNFVINHALPDYANGKLLVRDHLQFDNGLYMHIPGSNTKTKTGSLMIPSVQTKHIGYIEVRDNSGTDQYIISDATVFEKNNPKATFQQLEYYVDGNTLDIALPGNFLDRQASSYPVVIDPLVSTATTSPIPPAPDGSNYLAAIATRAGCATTNLATTPANVTVTDIQFANQYTARNGAVLNDGLMEFYLGTCRSPGAYTGSFASTLWWFCNPIIPAAGTCTAAGGATYSMWADFSTCVSPPQCAPYNLNVTQYVYQTYLTTANCANTYIYISTPLTITVFGHTVEIVGGAAGITATPATICAGSSSTLSVSGTYGVPPYTWSWTPGPIAGTPAVVSPTITTTYTATVTDACGITASATKVVTVNPTATITGNTTVCVGNTITLSNGGVAGAWTSLTPAVATITTPGGVVTGVAAGTDVIRFTTTAGACVSTFTITVTPLPGVIGGPTSVCTGNTITLINATAGGTWSSNNSAIATIDPSTGVATGVTAGTATITYSLGGTCYVTTNITVILTNPITGIATVCAGGTTTLSDATPGGTWSSNNPALATVGLNNGIVSGISAGSLTITYTSPAGCIATIAVTVNQLAPITGNTPICAGDTHTLADAAGGGTWSSGSPGVATIDVTSGNLTGISGGTASITYTTPSGCFSVATQVVNPLPVISNFITTDPTTCQGTDGVIALQGLTTGSTYSVTYSFNGGLATNVTIVAGPGTQVLITGLSSGTYSGIFVTDAVTGCVSNIVGPATLVDPTPPPAPTLTSNSPICIGQTLLLHATDAAGGGTYSWTGPAGFTSVMQDPTIVNAPIAASGPYTVTYTLKNCPSSTTADIQLFPPLVLTNVTLSQTIPFGSSIQLNADGASYYWWQPNDGSIDNPNINNPWATPIDSVTNYIVIGTNPAGCKDTAMFTITLDNTMTEIVPSAFTPNGDGLNDVFRISNLRYQKLVEFNVYNRWGQLVYHNGYDTKEGWDGTFNGVPQDAGVYNYHISIINTKGIAKHYAGTVTLIR